MHDEIKNKWEAFLQIVKDNITEDQFHTWFSVAELKDCSGNRVTVSVPTDFFIDRWEGEYYALVKHAMRRVYGNNVELIYEHKIISDDAASSVVTPANKISSAFTNRIDAITAQKREKRGPSIDSNLNPTLTFENYCVGESNKLPFTIAQHISDNSAKSDFNPFFLYGPVGVGKTHLIQAIGIRIKEHNPNAKVLYTTMRMFQNSYANASMQKKIPNFINWFQQLDVIIFDDLQTLSNKSGTMDALFPIFNHLHQNKKNLIFACDRPPCDLDGISDRLIDRFKWGLTEELKHPDYTLRKQILTFKAEKNGLDLSEEIIDYIARHSAGSVRELEGIVMGIFCRSIATDGRISLDVAREVMKHSIKPIEKKAINFDMIIETTAEHYKISPDAIFSRIKVNDIAEARQVIMYLAHKHTDLSSNAIGGRLNRQHPTVLYGIRNIEKRMSVCKKLSAVIEEIEDDLMR